MTHPFPTFAIRPSHASRFGLADVRLDWYARLGFLLTFLKIPMTALVLVLLAAHQVAVVNFLVVGSIIMDIADGVIFNISPVAGVRYLRESRRIWDGALDRLLIWTTLAAAVSFTGFPAWLFAVIMAREFLVCAATSIPYLQTGFVHSPNWPSKIGAILIAVQLIWFNVTGETKPSLCILFVSTSTVGLVLYRLRPKPI